MIDEALARATRDWRRVIRGAYPLSANTPVILGGDPKATAPFEAYTDNRAIHININRPADFEADFARFAVPHYQAAAHLLYGVGSVDAAELAQNLPYDLLMLVLFHELFHPLVCPNSRADEKAVSKAIYDGIKEREPALGPKEVVYKVDHCKNLVWDFVVNVTFLARSEAVRRDVLKQRIGDVFRENRRAIRTELVVNFPRGMMPLLYLASAMRGTADPLISLAGMFYVSLSFNEPDLRVRSMRVFLDVVAKQGMDEKAAFDLLRGMVRGIVDDVDEAALKRQGVDKAEFIKRSELVGDCQSRSYEQNQAWLLRAMDTIFDAYELRYDALRGMAKQLAPLISLSAKQGSPDPGTTGSGGEGEEGEGGEGEEEPSEEEKAAGSLAKTIDDLEEELGKDGTEGVLKEMAGNPEPAQGGQPGAGGQGGPAGQGGGLSAKTVDALKLFARDELLKRTAEPIDIRTPAPGMAVLDLGKQLRWDLKRSQDLTAAELASLDLTTIIQAQVATGLPILLQLAEDRYKLNEFVLAESPVRAWAPQQFDTNLPENWILLLDSSGSMCGAPFELLLRATYGLKKGMFDICTQKKIDLKFGVVNFSSRTVFSGLDSFRKVYASHTHKTKQVLFEQQNGGTTLDPAVFAQIRRELAPGRTVYTLITDGEISNQDAVYQEIERIAKEPNAAFLFLEISSSSALGQKLAALEASRLNVIYRKLNKIEEMKQSLQSLLIRYLPVGGR